MLYRPHRLYLFLAVAWLAIFLTVRPEAWLSFGAGTFVAGILLAFLLQSSSRTYAVRLLQKAAAGDERARRAYLARTRSRFGDVSREYLETLITTEDERVLPLMVQQLGHPDVLAREMAEDRLNRWGTVAAEPVAQAALGRELTGDGAFRARRLLWRWRPELPSTISALLETSGYWQDA